MPKRTAGKRDLCCESAEPLRAFDQTPQCWPTKAAIGKPRPAPSGHWIPIQPRPASACQHLGFASTVHADPAKLADAFRRIAGSAAGCWLANFAVSAIVQENRTPMLYSGFRSMPRLADGSPSTKCQLIRQRRRLIHEIASTLCQQTQTSRQHIVRPPGSESTGVLAAPYRASILHPPDHWWRHCRKTLLENCSRFRIDDV